jgi:hypothetical protein
VNINAAFPSTYIKASDLNGKTVTVTIREVKVELIGKDKESRPVMYFEGKEKGLVLNKTNARKSAGLVGDGDTDNWTGFKIAIFPTEVEFSGDMVEAIRVKAAPPVRAAAPAPPPPSREPGEDDVTADDIGF